MDEEWGKGGGGAGEEIGMKQEDEEGHNFPC